MKFQRKYPLYIQSRRSSWPLVFVAMTGFLGCTAEPTIHVTMPGEVITEIPNAFPDIKQGDTEVDVEAILRNAEFIDEPSISRITSPDVTESDCGEGNPILSKTYKRHGEYEGEEVEFHYSAYFKDMEENSVCQYVVTGNGKLLIRKPSYMKDMTDAKNQ